MLPNMQKGKPRLSRFLAIEATFAVAEVAAAETLTSLIGCAKSCGLKLEAIMKKSKA